MSAAANPTNPTTEADDSTAPSAKRSHAQIAKTLRELYSSASSGPGRPSPRAQIAKTLRVLYLIALVVFCAVLAVTRRAEIVELLEGTRLAMVAAALLATLASIVLGARVWAAGLAMLGRPTPLRDIMTATCRALPARYVPVGLSFTIARVALLRARGVSVRRLTAAAGLEMALAVTVTLGLGTALLAASGTLPGGLAWTVAALVATGAGASPAIGGRVLAWIAARRGVSVTMTWGGYLRLSAASSVHWLFSSATFVIYLRAFPAADGYATAQIAGAFMVAWAVGFLTVLAPQGFGVAELSLLALLPNPEVESVAMAVVFGGFRLVQLARDMLAAAAAEVISTRRARRESRPTG